MPNLAHSAGPAADVQCVDLISLYNIEFEMAVTGKIDFRG